MGSNEEGVADRGSEEEPDARADQWSLIKSTISMVNAMKDKMDYGEAQEGVEEDQVTSEGAASKQKFEELGDHAPARKMFKED
ncbi:hypothetical protein L5515_015435 [Caenorhabditis briggsae]|uniref:Uncharacterized protein n=1 Tax=Caenorhabditis briggsae TaxID=6238 RepID=A0AAE9EBT7_CAEBR|nr:hypothetical protein L5515_015435 [Caenorhabditis briggsae]